MRVADAAPSHSAVNALLGKGGDYDGTPAVEEVPGKKSDTCVKNLFHTTCNADMM